MMHSEQNGAKPTPWYRITFVFGNNHTVPFAKKKSYRTLISLMM
jgi:hypothetical protein